MGKELLGEFAVPTRRPGELGYQRPMDLDDHALREAFDVSMLPAAEWHHRSHVRVAFLHVTRWKLDEAHVRMRVGIIRLNAFHGLEETITRGYHETLTRFWLVAVAAVAQRQTASPAADSRAFCDAHPELLEKAYPLRFYSQARLFSPTARSVFVEPDVMPLPAVDAA